MTSSYEYADRDSSVHHDMAVDEVGPVKSMDGLRVTRAVEKSVYTLINKAE
jgi:hypothetical protein